MSEGADYIPDNANYSDDYDRGYRVGRADERACWEKRLEMLKFAHEWPIWLDEYRVGERALAIMEGRWQEYDELLALKMIMDDYNDSLSKDQETP